MLIFWRIRYLDRVDKQFKNRDLFLDTAMLPPAKRAAVELVAESRSSGNDREVLTFRSLFTEGSWADWGEERLNASVQPWAISGSKVVSGANTARRRRHMTVVFYRGLSRLNDLEQVPIKPALVDKARPKDVLKTCLKRALTTCFSAISCAGHVMEDGWKGFSARREAAQVPYFTQVAEWKVWPVSCAGYVLDLLTSMSTVLLCFVQAGRGIGGRA